MTASGSDDTLAPPTEAGEHVPAPGVRVDLSRGAVVGRYVVTGELGAGAMGVVYAAYDPELDRKVALKLLDSRRSDSTASHGHQQRLLREAQALAKLSHPNVVAVHDVGVHDDRVFIAMELVRGRTLRAWLKDKAPHWSKVLDVFVSAGRGLAAAHEEGLVHRDFKPDNVMLAEDDRARVMDFGLARANADVATTDALDDGGGTPREPLLGLALTHGAAIVGTPAYMAPEQIAGTLVKSAADQFSFCVSLWEGVFGERPFRADTLAELATNVLAGRLTEPPASAKVPRWLRRVLLRGLAVDPQKRWPSMDALLVALRRGRTLSRWRSAALTGGAIAVLVVGGVAWRVHDVQRRSAACESDGESIRAVWNADVRAELRAALVGMGLDYAEATAKKVMPWLDAQADAWQSARTEACLDTDVRGIWDEKTLDRAVWCLDERRAELDALVTELKRAQPGAVEAAVRGAAALTRVDPCRDVELLLRLPVPPTGRYEEVDAVRVELSRARALQNADESAEGLAMARDALARAEEIAWPPLTASARHRVGSLLESQEEYAPAEKVLELAYFEAAIAGANEVGALAAEDLAFLVGARLARREDGLRWSRHAEVMLAGGSDPGQLREARHVSRLGEIHRIAGVNDEAQIFQARALALRERALGPDHPDLVVALGALARVHNSAGEHAEAKALHARGLAILEEAVGPDHPDVAAALSDMGREELQLGEHARAHAHVARALAILEKVRGADHPIVAGVRINLAYIDSAMGANEDARIGYERALASLEKTLGPEHLRVASALNNLAYVHKDLGELERAKTLHERALAIREKALGAEHPDVAKSLDNLGEVELAMGAHDRARLAYERALAIHERTLGPDHLGLCDSLIGLTKVALDQHLRADAVRFAERAVMLREKGDADAKAIADARLLLARALELDPPLTSGG